MSATIDDKLRLFHKAIFEKLEEKKAKQIQDFLLKRDEVIKEKQDELQRKLELIKKETTKRAKTKALEIISKEEAASHSEILSLKGKLIIEVEKAVEEKLKDFTSSHSYKNFYLKNLQESFNSLQKGSYIFFCLKKDLEGFYKELKDLQEKYKDIKLTFETLEEEAIGGFILEDDDFMYKYDCTLRNMLLESQEAIGIMVTEALA